MQSKILLRISILAVSVLGLNFTNGFGQGFFQGVAAVIIVLLLADIVKAVYNKYKLSKEKF